jgi:hypothetical protein
MAVDRAQGSVLKAGYKANDYDLRAKTGRTFREDCKLSEDWSWMMSQERTTITFSDEQLSRVTIGEPPVVDNGQSRRISTISRGKSRSRGKIRKALRLFFTRD